MNKNNDFVPSFNNYKKILTLLNYNKNRLIDYGDIDENTTDFIVVRHDVEFSVERAYNLSKIETSMGFKSSYLFQVTNNAYNVLAKKNIDMIREMSKNGHYIGLHFHLNGKTNIENIKDAVKFDARILQDILELKIDRFSFHRPTNEVLRANLVIDGLINTYDNKFFTFVEKVSPNEKLNVKYVADSMHKWNYGQINEQLINENRKIQILIHPYSWTEEGYNNLNNFKSLMKEKREVLINTMDTECNHFGEIKNEL